MPIAFVRHAKRVGSRRPLASLLGVDKSAIAHTEAARKSPSVHRIVALAKELNVTTDYLLGVAS